MKKNYKGFGYYIGLVLIVVLVWFFLDHQQDVNNTYNYTQFETDLKNEDIISVVVNPNREIPTGIVEITKTDSSREKLYVSDVKDVEELMRENGFSNYRVDDVPAFNWLLMLLPLLLVFGAMFILFVIMNNQAAGGGGGSKMMNFGKSRAKMTTDENKKVTFQNVAGLREEKEELEEIVDFLKEPKKYTRLGARIPKGVLLVGPPGNRKDSACQGDRRRSGCAVL